MLATLGSGYEVLNDLTFVIDGDSTQVDHVVVSTKGVFLIETKNFTGRVFGQANETHWTQIAGRTKRKFQNPLRLVQAIVSTSDARLNNAQTFTIRQRLEKMCAATREKTAQYLAILDAKHGGDRAR